MRRITIPTVVIGLALLMMGDVVPGGGCACADTSAPTPSDDDAQD